MAPARNKVVLRRFEVDDVPYFLLVQCSQETDERSESELTFLAKVGPVNGFWTR